MKIKNIIFDLGGVVLTKDWHTKSGLIESYFMEVFGMEKKEMECAFNAMWPDFQRGHMTEEEFWKGFLKIGGSKEMDIEKAKNLWREHQKTNDGMLDIISKLKENYRLGALSVISKEWFDFKNKKFSLNYYFDIIVTSGYTGISKPSKEVYEIIIDNMGIDPKETLFIDDEEKNLVTGKELGMKTLLFRNRNELEISLREIGIIL